ncbi:class I SAM-dependent methyltransferase [Streptomyces olivaceus]|uniref:class I SAM-dependent methyltransferase n=1 Tax=Streptomyces olivaceus TaxID=47716 RepID=UPI001884FFCC|nr:class I SAM-dependent methyltransferase [Streptomyces olivaceus]
MGDDYPSEIGASSSCDWPLLGLMAARLRMAPGRLLVHAGCGNGGIGLWLSRALAVHLYGFGLSPVAVAHATGRQRHFLGEQSMRASFRVAALEKTGLPDHVAHGIVCVNALTDGIDKAAVVYELGRILAPGGRLVMTRSQRAATPPWQDHARAAGLQVEHVDEHPGEPAMWERLYRLWIEHAEGLRRELGEDQARGMGAGGRARAPRPGGRPGGGLGRAQSACGPRVISESTGLTRKIRPRMPDVPQAPSRAVCFSR